MDYMGISKTIISKGAYIKYVRGGAEGFYNFFQKKLNFVAQETIDINFSRPSNFFRKYVMAPPINSSFLFKALLVKSFRVVLTTILKFQILKKLTFTIIFKK